MPNNKDDGVFLKKRRSYQVAVEVFDDSNFSLAKKSFNITKVGFSKDFNNDGYDDFLLGNPMLNTVALIYGGRDNLTRLDNDIVPDANDLDGMLFGKSYSYGDYNGDGNLQLSIGAEGSKKFKYK